MSVLSTAEAANTLEEPASRAHAAIDRANVSLRVVMPVLDEGNTLAQRLHALQPLRQRGAELVLVDGGSTDSTWALARALADQVLLAPRGRAAQMNAGAQWCSALKHDESHGKAAQNEGADIGEASVLLFLHADTQLPKNADQLIAQAVRQGHHQGQQNQHQQHQHQQHNQPYQWGRFDIRIDGRHPLLRVVERLMNLRSRLSGIATGDQAMFVRRDVFERLGGFADLPLMEDIELSKRLKKLGPPACAKMPVTTSARRWEEHGVWRTIVLMWRLRMAYFFGANPDVLALRYGYLPRSIPVAAVLPAAMAILAKAPVAGLAKTRLIPVLGAAGAARAQRRFTLNTLQVANAAITCAIDTSAAAAASSTSSTSTSTSTSAAAAATPATQSASGWLTPLSTPPPLPLTLWCAPDATHRFFRALRRVAGTVCINQPQGDIGARMLHAFEHHFAHHADLPLLLVGTDCPMLAPGHLQQAAQALIKHDVVLIPAEDGGYVLIGMRVLVPQVFEGIAWSTPQVMAQTRKQLRRAGVTWCEMPTLWDVDEPADWRRLQRLEQLE